MNKPHGEIVRKNRGLAILLLIISLAGNQTRGEAEKLTLKHLYTVDRYNQNVRFLSPTAVFLDTKRQEIYLCDSGTGRLIILNAAGGELLGFFEHRLKGQSAKMEPVGVAINDKGAVLVADSSVGKVYEYSYRGEPAGNLQMPGAKNDCLPGKMAVDAAGNVYVAVRNAGKIVVFDPSGQLKSEITAPSTSHAEGYCDVAVGDNGNVYALSPNGTAIYVFDKLGKLIRNFGEHEAGKSGFAHPSGIDVDSKGRIWVTDIVSHTLKVFSEGGTFVAELGGFGAQPGDFFSPSDICIDRVKQRLFIAEKTGRRLQVFSIEEK